MNKTQDTEIVIGKIRQWNYEETNFDSEPPFTTGYIYKSDPFIVIEVCTNEAYCIIRYLKGQHFSRHGTKFVINNSRNIQ